MTREYLRVTPTAAPLDPDAISNALASFHKLELSKGAGPAARLNPFKTKQPLAFEFVAISDGEDEPVEFYYGADARLDVVQQRLRTIYPSSFDIDHFDYTLIESF